MKNAVFCDVVLVRIDVSQECIASVIRVKEISELGETSVGADNWFRH
jgi:hypothetical protein